MTLDDLALKLDSIAAELVKLRAESVIDPEFSQTEAAGLLRLSSRQVQVLRLAGNLGFYRHGKGVTIGASHIAAYQKDTENTPRRVRAAERKLA